MGSDLRFLVGWLVGWEINVLFQHKNKLYQGQGFGWRFSPTRLSMANDTVTPPLYRRHCLFCSATVVILGRHGDILFLELESSHSRMIDTYVQRTRSGRYTCQINQIIGRVRMTALRSVVLFLVRRQIRSWFLGPGA